ncbi:helix-turn-helix transcriptional regulator [Devosia sediminis]|uniref:AlpA family phage regulatory protein n=1 Tax=Devosia sediminis TaxID=2798801 RepID=A0A934IRI1_9HYPH|nr:AlpA family phage regulatory protein [Devosia sediminis]MBJ3783861.1 AlpA family phage regulatory protein [Devosia sediminis]
MPDNQFPLIISVKDVCKLTSLSRASISKIRAAGNFPTTVQLGEKRIGFVRAEVQAWIDARIAARPANDNAHRDEVAA